MGRRRGKRGRGRSRGWSIYTGRLFDRIQETIILVVVAVAILAGISLELTESGAWVSLPMLFLGIAAVIAFVIVARWVRWILKVLPIVRRRLTRFEKYTQVGLKQLRTIDPFEFERFVGFLYERQGYHFTASPDRGDHGLDGVLGKDGKRYALQVKRYDAHVAVSEPELRDFFGSFVDSGYVGGKFVTTSDFTPQAKKWAKQRPLELIDGKRLLEVVWEGERLPWYRVLWAAYLRAPETTLDPTGPPLKTKVSQSPVVAKPNSESTYQKFWKD